MMNLKEPSRISGSVVWFFNPQLSTLVMQLETSTDRPRDMGIVPDEKVLLPPNARSANVESKVDALAEQLSQLSLIIKKQTTQPGGPPGGSTRLCSFCKKEGHAANRCPSNPHRDSMCARCGKKGHAEVTCWARVTPDTNLKVGFR